MNLKNLVFALIFIFPLIVTAIFITRIIIVDSKLELVKEYLILKSHTITELEKKKGTLIR
jgi:hypothetical protein